MAQRIGLVARIAFGPYAAGEYFEVSAFDAIPLLVSKKADFAPRPAAGPKPATRRTYRRRDLRAEP